MTIKFIIIIIIVVVVVVVNIIFRISYLRMVLVLLMA